MSKIEISTGIIWRMIMIVLVLWLLFLVRDILFLLLLAVVMVSAALPVVDKLETKKIPRPVSALGLYLSFFLFVALILYLVIPLLLHDIKQLGEFLPVYLEGLNNALKNLSEVAISYNFENNLQQLLDESSQRIGQAVSGVFSNAISFLGGFLKIVVVVSLSFYMLVRKNGTVTLIESVTPKEHQEYVTGLVQRIQRKMGRWLIGQLSLIGVIFGLDFLVLTLAGVPFALMIALWGGLLEIIPYIGPMLAIIPAVLIALTISPWTALAVGIGYVVIQQLENHILTPLIMKKAVGLNPVIIILALLIGGKLAGVLGVILAVPVATAIGVFVQDLLARNQKNAEDS